MIVLYVAAAVAANLMAYAFGPAVTPYTALVLIGFNFTARDSLHDDFIHCDHPKCWVEVLERVGFRQIKRKGGR
jgi:hypothetical protein